MKFCLECAAAMTWRVPDGEDRERWVCSDCGYIHYENPRTVAGCIVEHEGQLLLCRRSIEPARGLWTFPAGFLELRESTIEGAVRETLEEAEAKVAVTAPHAYLDVPHISQVYAVFRARMVEPHFGAGAESLEAKLFTRDEIPWDEISFPVIHFALRLFVADREEGRAQVHLGTLVWSGEGSRYDAGRYRLEGHLAIPLADAHP